MLQIITFVSARFGAKQALPATKLGSGDIVGVAVVGAGPLVPLASGVITDMTGGLLFLAAGSMSISGCIVIVA